MYWPDGKRFDGQFVKGQQHGTGLFLDPKAFDGAWKQGVWEMGIR